MDRRAPAGPAGSGFVDADQVGARPPSISLGDEIARKAIHMCSLSIPIGAHVFGYAVALPVIGALALVFLLFDGLRALGFGPVRAFVLGLFGRVLRSHEDRALTGGTYLLVTAVVCLYLFPMSVFCAAFAFLVLGDTAAALVGRRWGRHRFGGKSAEGSLACLAACVIAVPFVPNLPLHAGLAGALAATVAEALTGSVEDNVAMPVIAGGLMVALL